MARQKGGAPEKEVDPNEWLVTYADLVTLLLVFFIVLYAMANTDLKNFEKLALSLRIAFNGVSQYSTSSIIKDTDNSSSHHVDQLAPAPIFFENQPPKRKDFLRISRELTSYAQKMGLEGDISINMTTEGIIISLSNKLIFEPGTVELRPQAKEVLDEVAKILETNNNEVRVVGHTDNLPTNSPLYPTNWELSTLRAVSVVRYLAEERGLAPERFNAAGSSEYKPVVPNDSRANRALNRRADIIIVYPGEKRRFSISIPGS